MVAANRAGRSKVQSDGDGVAGARAARRANSQSAPWPHWLLRRTGAKIRGRSPARRRLRCCRQVGVFRFSIAGLRMGAPTFVSSNRTALPSHRPYLTRWGRASIAKPGSLAAWVPPAWHASGVPTDASSGIPAPKRPGRSLRHFRNDRTLEPARLWQTGYGQAGRAIGTTEQTPRMAATGAVIRRGNTIYRHAQICRTSQGTAPGWKPRLSWLAGAAGLVRWLSLLAARHAQVEIDGFAHFAQTPEAEACVVIDYRHIASLTHRWGH